jgi:hypothetical protein
MPTVPTDGRLQASGLDVMMANTSLGRPAFAGVGQIGADRYVLANSWPTPAPTRVSGSSPAPAVEAPARRTAAHALWPNLK